jgi:hypothetical protein
MKLKESSEGNSWEWEDYKEEWVNAYENRV